VGDLDTVGRETRRAVRVESEAFDLLLFNFLQEVIFYKDGERLLLRPESVRIEEQGGLFSATAELVGEELDMNRHDLVVDVKAVTLHKFQVAETERGWEAFVILDI
jgi:SHS2 domain-containing protein